MLRQLRKKRMRKKTNCLRWAKEKTKRKIQINNKRASFDYEFLETYEAGIVLVGTEIKSLRAGKASLSDAYCYFSNG